MKYLALSYMILITLNIVITPLLFGVDRGQYTWKNWMISLITNTPLFYLLVKIFNEN